MIHVIPIFYQIEKVVRWYISFFKRIFLDADIHSVCSTFPFYFGLVDDVPCLTVTTDRAVVTPFSTTITLIICWLCNQCINLSYYFLMLYIELYIISLSFYLIFLLNIICSTQYLGKWISNIEKILFSSFSI